MSRTGFHSSLPTPPKSELFAAFGLFFLGQLATLAIGLADFRLAAKPELTTRPLTLAIMLIAQLALTAAIAAELLASIRLAAWATVLSFPFTQTAVFISQGTISDGLLCSLVLFLWLAGTTCWLVIWRKHSYLLSTIFSLWIIGSPLWYYLMAEFHPNPMGQNILWFSSPVLLASRFPADKSLLLGLALYAGIAVLALGVRYLIVGHRKNFTNSLKTV